MGRLTETEIFDCLASNLKAAASDADALAKESLKGEIYDRFRRELLLIEGACRQASVWREDTRWLEIGLMMAEVHRRCGDWLRGIKAPDGTRVKIGNGELHPLFVRVADNLRGFLIRIEKLRVSATHRSGMILPATLAGPHRDMRPVGWSPSLVPAISPNGIILPRAGI
jgi:hypothetical protein